MPPLPRSTPGVRNIARVEGLRELSRAFAVADKELGKELRKSLADVGAPIARDAELGAIGRIRNIRSKSAWWEMRTGATRTYAYVAPKRRGPRGGKRKRRNLADLLLERSMLPALDRNISNVETRFGRVLDDVGRAWERSP